MEILDSYAETVPLLFIFRFLFQQYPLHIIRQFTDKVKQFTGDGMGKGQPVRVQRLSVYKLIGFGIIEEITDERMADGLHMYPDLMGSSCLKADGSEREPFAARIGSGIFFVFEKLQSAIVSNGRFTPLLIHTAHKRRAFHSGNRRIDRTVFRKKAFHDGKVIPVYLSVC